MLIMVLFSNISWCSSFDSTSYYMCAWLVDNTLFLSRYILPTSLIAYIIWLLFPIESRLCFFFEVTLVILLVFAVCYTVSVARL